MKVINLIGAPCSGKSTTAAALFAYMKKNKFNVELVTEYAKDMVWENRPNILDDQLYILAKQNRRLCRLHDKVDWVITDSPLLINMVYVPFDYYSSFPALVKEVWDRYNNITLYMAFPSRENYIRAGRVQTYEEAKEVDTRLTQIVAYHAPSYKVITRFDAPEDIYKLITDHKVENE